MNPLVLPVLAVLASCVSAAVGDDYILRVDTIGYSDQPTSSIEPQETTLRSIEVVARPHSLFHGRVNVGTETITLTGKLRPADNGEFEVKLNYEYSVDTGMTVPGDDGVQEAVIGKSSVQTIVTVPVDQRVVIGGLDMQAKRPGKHMHNTKSRRIVILTKYAPLSD